MKTGMKRLSMIGASALLLLSAAVSFSTYVYAGYQRQQIIQDPSTSSNLGISGEGKRLTSYYLDIGLWGTIDNAGISFWALVYKDNGDSTPTVLKYIKGEVNGSNYSYSLDRAVYDRIKFFRTASSNDETLAASSTYSHSFYTSGGGLAYDASAQLSFDSTKVTYQVTGWHSNWIDCSGYWR